MTIDIGGVSLNSLTTNQLRETIRECQRIIDERSTMAHGGETLYEQRSITMHHSPNCQQRKYPEKECTCYK